ncbi:MAG: hypothetical protein AAGA92_07360 [Planctomycetota bacterium]
MNRLRCSSIATLAVVLAVVGCGRELPETAAVTGTVTVGGQPLDEVSVLFIPSSSGKFSGITSSDITDADGRFELEYKLPDPKDPSKPTFGPGAMPGSYAVVVSDYRMLSEMLDPPGRVPEHYGDAGTTPLECVVGTDDLVFDIEVAP